MKRPDLDAIEARGNATTPGPWRQRYSGLFAGLQDGCGYVFGQIDDDGNRNFIAHAREDISALLAYIRELESRLFEKKENVE